MLILTGLGEERGSEQRREGNLRKHKRSEKKKKKQIVSVASEP